MQKFLLLALALVLFSSLHAQIPSGYYDGTDNLYGDALKQTLHNIIKGHTELSYDDLKWLLKYTDEDPNNSANIILLYTGRSQSKASFGGDVNDWNREHVWAKSHGDFGDNKPCGTDAHHIRPTDASVNSSRGNKDFDEGGSPDSEATLCNSTASTWEPRDEVKGDVARMLFYMAVRYEGTDGEPDLELKDVNNTDGTPFFGKMSTLMAWHIQDPVDDFERNRNDVIYNYQYNRNPFIDHEEYVYAIWGENADVEEKPFYEKEVTASFYPNPVRDVLNISTPQLIGKKMTVVFYNAIGTPVKTIKDIEVTRKNTIKLYDLEQGAYFVKIISGDFSKVERVVVEK